MLRRSGHPDPLGSPEILGLDNTGGYLYYLGGSVVVGVVDGLSWADDGRWCGWCGSVMWKRGRCCGFGLESEYINIILELLKVIERREGGSVSWHREQYPVGYCHRNVIVLCTVWDQAFEDKFMDCEILRWITKYWTLSYSWVRLIGSVYILLHN
jgi:hypothetical protein